MPERGFATETWTEDSWFQALSLEQRYVFIYLWTNNHCKQAGVYSTPLATMAWETKIEQDDLIKLIKSLSPKVEWYPERNIIWVKNFLRRQAKSSKFVIAALKNLDNHNIPEDLRAEFELYNQDLLGEAPSQQMSLTRRESVLIRDNFHCQYCDKEITEESDFEIDHITPTSKGGKDNYLNLVATCKDCNQTKLDRLPTEAGLPTPKPSTFHASQALYLLRTDEKLKAKWLSVFPKRVSVSHLILTNIGQRYSRLFNIAESQRSQLKSTVDTPLSLSPVSYTNTVNKEKRGCGGEGELLARISSKYQEEIGVISSAIADGLKDFAESFRERKAPVEWIDEAFSEAAAHNKRSWAYVKAILKSWVEEGKGARVKPSTTTHSSRKLSTSDEIAKSIEKFQKKKEE